MLRRSNSSSHIPVPRNDGRTRSRSTARASTRGGSTDKLPPVKRSVSSVTLKRSTLMTPTTVQPFKRSSNLPTPSSSSSARGKSPYRLGSGKSDKNKQVNDKKWVNEQYIKVQKFLLEHPNCDPNIPNQLKPPTINSFIYVVGLLLREIDGRVNITTANYKEAVIKSLKVLRYPGSLSNSMLKIVNTMHSWPQVICIFAWLVDYIIVIKQAELSVEPMFDSDNTRQIIECVSEYHIKRYSLYNDDEDQTQANVAFQQKLSQILNIDEKEMSELEEELTELTHSKEKQSERIAEVKNENNLLKKELDDLEYECETFYVVDAQKHEELDHIIECAKQKKNRLVGAIKTTRESIAQLKGAIAKQPYTYEEKVRLQAKLDELRHIVELEKQAFEAKKALKKEHALKLAETKRKVQSEVYRLNTELMPLTVIMPELKVLELKGSEVITEGFEQEINRVTEEKKRLEKKIDEEIESTKKTISLNKTNLDKLEQEITTQIKKIESLSRQEIQADENLSMYEERIETLMKERENMNKMIKKHVKLTEELDVELASQEEELAKLEILKKKKEAELKQKMEHSVQTFIRVREEVLGHVQQLNEVRTKVVDNMEEKLKQVHAEQSKILEDLTVLKAIGDVKKE